MCCLLRYFSPFHVETQVLFESFLDSTYHVVKEFNILHFLQHPFYVHIQNGRLWKAKILRFQ